MCTHDGSANLGSGSLGLRPQGCYSAWKHGHVVPQLPSGVSSGQPMFFCFVFFSGLGPGSQPLGQPGGMSARGGLWDCFSYPAHGHMVSSLAWSCVC